MSAKKFTLKYINNVLDNPIKYAKNININELTKFLSYCTDIYSNSSKEIITDEIFDNLKDILEKRDPNNSFISQIGAPINNKEKIKLPYPMGSLDKFKPENNKISSWIKKYPGPYAISDKLDGVSAQLIKQDKTLKLYSRGDGIEGRDISHLIKFLVKKNVIDKIPNNMSLRGEIIMSKENFEKINDRYKNSRSTISGLINSDIYDFDEQVAKYAELVIYNIISPSDITQYEKMKLIEKIGLKCVWNLLITHVNNDDKNNLENILKIHLLDRRENSEFMIDGIVCIDSSTEYEHKKGNPKHGFAFKMKLDDQMTKATVVDVEWEPTMYAYIQPTVVIKPVEIGGSVIERATGHNAKYIKDNKIGPGAIINIIKSGDVIPYILKVIKKVDKPKMPEYKYKWNDTKYEIIVTNPNKEIAFKIGIRRVIHFFKTLKIKFLSEGIITKLFENGYTNLFGIISIILSSEKEDLYEINGFGKKLIDKIYNEINKKLSTCELHILMGASLQFGRGLGTRKIKIIIDNYPDILSKKREKNSLFSLIGKLDGFSDISTQQFVNNFEKFTTFFKKLKKSANIIPDFDKTKVKKSKSKELFKNQTIVFTGFRDDNLENFITTNGGKVTTSVSSNTSLLVYVLKDNKKSNKIIQAEDKNIKIIEKDKFKNKYKL